ncbi:hypothetical protein [Flavobacterium sp.]|uniref:hypothetical protein n=1 Tax=Flavobacterium sp. TaxID=239 RepID=UPI0026188F7B|nr:hypothetical protein [Flavobacterium sp.]
MKYYLSDIIPRIQQFSKRLDENTLFTSNEWVQFNQESLNRVYYIFKKNGELLVTEKGIGKKIKWENLGNGRITIEEESTFYHFRIAFYDGLFLVMNLNDTNDYVFLLNETKLGVDFKTINQINKKKKKKYNLVQSEQVVDFTLIDYSEHLPVPCWDLILGSFDTIRIEFSNGLKGDIYFGKQSKKYYYFSLAYGTRNYFDNKLDCIKELYKSL